MRTTAFLAAALLLGACGGSPVATTTVGVVEQVSVHGTLEQQIRIEPYDDPSAGGGEWLHLTTRIVNRGTAPVTVTTVMCLLNPAQHVRTTATIILLPLPSCAAISTTRTLGPGEGSTPTGFVGRIAQAGTYTLQVRQALDPEFWGEIEITAR